MRPDAPPPPEEDSGPAPNLPGDSVPSSPDDPSGSHLPRGRGRRRRRGRRGRGGRAPDDAARGDGPPHDGAPDEGEARADGPLDADGLPPEADAFEAPPLPVADEPSRERRGPSLLEPGAEALAPHGDAPGEPEGARDDGAEGRRGRRRRRRRGRDGRGADDGEGRGPAPVGPGEEPTAADDLTAEAGADLPAPDPAAPAPSGAASEGREARRERRRGRDRERQGGRREQRKERGARRPRDEEDLTEVHELPPLAPEEGEDAEALAAPRGPMVKTLLINATEPEEVRIALLEDGQLEEIYLETGHERSAAGNVYRGRVQNVERGIGAAFVDLGRGLMGFLHMTDLPDRPEGRTDAPVTELIEPGQEVLVQITRDSIGRKGPALTGRISLPGRYLVLMPNSDRSGVSRRIGQGRERDRMRRLMSDLEVPEGMGLIVRTAGESQPLELLRADLKHLLAEWEALQVKAAESGNPGLLRGESDVAERCVRDIMPADATRVIVDDPAMAERIRSLLAMWYPQRPAESAAPAAPSAPAEGAAAGEPAARDTAADVTAADVTAADVPAPPAAAVPPAPPVPREALPAPRPLASLPAPAPVPALPARAAPPPVVDDFAAGLLEPVPGVPAAPPPAGPADAPPVGGVPPLPPEEDEYVPPLEPEPARGDSSETASNDADESEEAPDEAREERAAAPRPTELPRPPEVEPWTDPMPLFHAHGVETQLEDALRRMIRLPSGGSIVIDPTEALVAIDVNSGRNTDEEDPEKTALVTNLEAVAAVTRQLRLRDLGGLVVIDFIDMRDRKAVRKVERALRAALVRDRARIRVDRIGPFGCVMLSRQRIRQALSRVTHEECTACAGTGRRRLLSGLSLRVLREMQARISRSRGRGGLEVRAPVAVVEWLKKHRSTALRDLRQVCTGPIRLEPDARLAADGWAMRGLPPEGGVPVVARPPGGPVPLPGSGRP